MDLIKVPGVQLHLDSIRHDAPVPVTTNGQRCDNADLPDHTHPLSRGTYEFEDCQKHEYCCSILIVFAMAVGGFVFNRTYSCDPYIALFGVALLIQAFINRNRE